MHTHIMHFMLAHFMPAGTSLQTVPAGIDVALAYRASEEAFAAITAGGSIVFPCGFISTDCTVTNDPIWTRQAWLCRHAVWSTKKNKIKHTQVNTNAYALCTRHSFKSDSLCAFYDDDDILTLWSPISNNHVVI